MKNTSFIGLFALMSMMTIGLTAAPIYGQASTYTDTYTSPVSFYIYNSCDNSFFLLEGTEHVTYHITSTPNGGQNYKVNSVLQLTGDNAGTQYKFHYNFHDSFSYQPGASQQYGFDYTYRIISSGSGDNLIGQGGYTIHIDADGKPHYKFDFGTPKCVG